MFETKHKRRTPFLRFFINGMISVLVVSGLMFLASERGWIHQWEMFGTDPFLRAHTLRTTILLVEITDEDYKTYFRNSSPLDRDQVCDLILAVAKAHPAQIIVDLDLTDFPTAKCKPPLKLSPGKDSFEAQVQANIAKLPEPKPVIIWAQTLQFVPESARCAASEVKPLGSVNSTPPGVPQSHLAIPLFPRDRDGVVRSYLRTVPVWTSGACKFWPTMAFAASHFGNEPATITPDDSRDNRLYLNFSGDRYAFERTDAGSFLRGTSNSAQLQPWTTVVIGGTFAAARDEYFTPVGPISGMELTAFAFESDSRNQGIRPATVYWSVGSDLVLGAGLVSLSYYWKGWRSLVGLSLIGIVAAIALSYLLFSSFNFLLSFVPAIIGAAVHFIWDALQELSHQEREIKHLEKKVRDLESANKELELRRNNGGHESMVQPTSVTVNVVENPGHQA